MQRDVLNLLRKNGELMEIQELNIVSNFGNGICPNCLAIDCVKEDDHTTCRECGSITKISQKDIPTMTVFSGRNLSRILESNQHELRIKSKTQ